MTKEKDHWVQAALTDDELVAELLLRMKHSSSSDSAKAVTKSTTLSLSPGWGHRKIRSKPTAPTTAVSNGCGKEHRGSPTTHLSWSGGGGSTSDGYDESSRPSDLSSGGGSVKANEVASTSGSQKRKSFIELNEEQELALTRANLIREQSTSTNLKTIKIDFGQNPSVGSPSCRVVEEEETKRGFELPDLKSTSLKSIKNPTVGSSSCRVVEEEETKRGFELADLKSSSLKRIKIDFGQNPTVGSSSRRVVEKEEETKRGFELPDLNMTPNEEDL